MSTQFATGSWAVILGGSSGFGLATAHKLAEHGMNLCRCTATAAPSWRASSPSSRSCAATASAC